MQSKRLCAIAGVTIALLAPVPLAAQVACQPVFDSLTKVVNTPTHIYNTGTSSLGKPRTSETIYAGGAIYIQVRGKWRRGTLTPEQVLKQEQANRQNSKYSCRYLNDEPINGEKAAVYSTHAETPDAKSDSRIWISKGKGLPLRQELDVDTGGKNGKNHFSMRYEFGNVKPPPLP